MASDPVFFQLLIILYIPRLYQTSSSDSLSIQAAISSFRREKALRSAPVLRKITNVKRASECLGYCHRLRPDCKAFNYARNSKTCDLLSQHICSEKGIKLEDEAGTNYYDLTPSSTFEREGTLWSTPYCRLEGYCSPVCEPILYLPYLQEACERDHECMMRSGNNAACRLPPGICKCATGYYTEGNSTCLPLPVQGFSLFPNAKAEGAFGSYYKLSTMELNFAQAANYCREVEGGYLAYAEDGHSNKFLRETMKKAGIRAAYIGLTDQEKEGAWIWTRDGDRLKTKQFWRSGAPDNANDNEHCAMTTNEIDFGWDDVSCETEGRFFCQRPEIN